MFVRWHISVPAQESVALVSSMPPTVLPTFERGYFFLLRVSLYSTLAISFSFGLNFS